jgi:hypothetical protein
VDLVDLLLVDDAALRDRRVDQQVDDEVPAEHEARERVEPAEEKVVTRGEAGFSGRGRRVIGYWGGGHGLGVLSLGRSAGL